jgi:hypothetical protein
LTALVLQGAGGIFCGQLHFLMLRHLLLDMNAHINLDLGVKTAQNAKKAASRLELAGR